MSKGGLRTPEVLAACVLALCVAAVRLLIARSLHFCGTPDACYYLGLGQNLASGHGFQARFLYDFQQARPSLPNTGIEYWRPGISLALQLLRPLGGVTLLGSIALTIGVGLLYAAAAWHFARQNHLSQGLALAAFALCLLSNPAWGGSLTPDSGLYYGAAVAWFLALFTVRRQGLWQDVVALLCVAAAYLIRNDAALLLVPLVAVLWQRHRTRQPGPSLPALPALLYAVLMLGGFALMLVPMHLIYRAVLGSAFPSGTSRAFFLNDLGDFVRYNDPASLHSLLSHGWKHLLLFRVATLVTALYRIAALVLGYAALLFLPALFLRNSPKYFIGNARLAQPPNTQISIAQIPVAQLPVAQLPDAQLPDAQLPELLGPAFLFAAMLAVYTLLLPAIGGFSILRSVLGVLPMVFVLVVLGAQRVARTPRLAKLLLGTLVATYAVSGLMEVRRDVEAANRLGAADRAVAAKLSAPASLANAIVLTPDPVQFSVTTGYAAVALPSNGLDAMVEAAHDFRATHVILNTEDLPASFEELKHRLHPLHTEELPAEHTLIFWLPAAGNPLPAN